MRLLDRVFKQRNPDVPVKPEPKPERTIVYLRTKGRTPALFAEAEVHYDAWGSPYVNWQPIFGHSSRYANELLSGGKTGHWQTQWRHKSGPDVIFPDKTAPDKGWFPR
jgi:hypothetical protein